MLADSRDDSSLVAAVARGDAAAYRTLVERYLDALVRYATRVLRDQSDAEDTAQDTFLRLWQNAASYSPKVSVSAWLHRIAHNAAIDRLRRRRESFDDECELRSPKSTQPYELLTEKRERLSFDTALLSLPARQRAALTLFFQQGLTLSETAQVLETGIESVESLLARGRKNLSKLLGPTDAPHQDSKPAHHRRG